MGTEKDLIQAEREKYEMAWSLPEYRKRSPGERVAPKVLRHFGMDPGESIIDYGCGTGRAAKYFYNQELQVLGIDFVKEAFEFENLLFMEACLWDDLTVWSDYAFCCDVLEHLPEKYVEQVIHQISSNTYKGAFFQVANHDSVLDGVNLHQVFWEWDRWLEIIGKYFVIDTHEPGDTDGNYRIFTHVKGAPRGT